MDSFIILINPSTVVIFGNFAYLYHLYNKYEVKLVGLCCLLIASSWCIFRETVWGVLTGQGGDNVSSLVVHEVREIETWILRLLSAPVPVPGKTRVEVGVSFNQCLTS